MNKRELDIAIDSFKLHCEAQAQYLREAYAEIARLNNVIQIPNIGDDLPKPLLCESCKAIGAAYRIGKGAADETC